MNVTGKTEHTEKYYGRVIEAISVWRNREKKVNISVNRNKNGS